MDGIRERKTVRSFVRSSCSGNCCCSFNQNPQSFFLFVFLLLLLFSSFNFFSQSSNKFSASSSITATIIFIISGSSIIIFCYSPNLTAHLNHALRFLMILISRERNCASSRFLERETKELVEFIFAFTVKPQNLQQYLVLERENSVSRARNWKFFFLFPSARSWRDILYVFLWKLYNFLVFELRRGSISRVFFGGELDLRQWRLLLVLKERRRSRLRLRTRRSGKWRPLRSWRFWKKPMLVCLFVFLSLF